MDQDAGSVPIYIYTLNIVKPHRSCAQPDHCHGVFILHPLQEHLSDSMGIHVPVVDSRPVSHSSWG